MANRCSAVYRPSFPQVSGQHYDEGHIEDAPFPCRLNHLRDQALGWRWGAGIISVRVDLIVMPDQTLCAVFNGCPPHPHFRSSPPDCERLFERALTQQRLAARAHDRILELARTVADIEEQGNIEPKHNAEAILIRAGRIFRGRSPRQLACRARHLTPGRRNNRLRLPAAHKIVE